MDTKKLDRLILITALALVGVLTGCGNSNILSSDGPRVTATDQLTYTLTRDDVVRLAATTVNGVITVRAGTGNEVLVTATREVKAPSRTFAHDFLEDVTVIAERQGSDVVLDTSYPNPPDRVDVNVDFDITAPPSLVTRIAAVNGVVSVSGMEAAVSVVTTNSVVDISGACGPLDVETVNGLITADLQELRGSGTFRATNGNITVAVRSGEVPISASTTNGAVSVGIPDGFDGTLDARTSNGEARSDVAVTLTQPQLVNRVVGTIGEGGSAAITLRSTNGSVRLLKVSG